MTSRTALARAVVAAILLASCALKAFAQTTAAITPDDLKRRLYLFADDSMLGRATASRGHARAAEYLVREVTRLELKPAGEPNSFYQRLPIDRVKVDLEAATLSTAMVTLKPGIDFLPVVGHFGVPFFPGVVDPRRLHVLFLGALSDRLTPAALDRLRCDSIGLNDSTLIVLQAPLRPDGRPDYQIWNWVEYAEQYRGARALLIETLDLTPSAVLAKLVAPALMVKPDSTIPPQCINPAVPPLEKPDKPKPVALPAVVSITRSAAGFLRLSPRNRANVQFRAETGSPGGATRNVVAMIEGSDRGRLGSEVVVLSARMDQMPTAAAMAREAGDSIMNGADLGGSGSMALLEIAEHLASLREKPKRTIVFLWTTGAEQGTLGSQFFVQRGVRDALADPLKPGGWLGTIVANINVDAIGRGGAKDVERGGANYLEIVGANPPSREFGGWVERVSKQPEFGLKIDDHFDGAALSSRAACAGDHWSFARSGIPSVLVTTGDHADARAVTDAPHAIDYEKYARVTRFLAALTVDIANQPSRPTLDVPKVGPLAPCN